MGPSFLDAATEEESCSKSSKSAVLKVEVEDSGPGTKRYGRIENDLGTLLLGIEDLELLKAWKS